MLYARCSGGPIELKGQFGGDIQLPYGLDQVRRQVAGGDVFTVLGDPSARWTVVVTRRRPEL
ncbi:hypothetical protein ACIA58_18680 [Kribbella sp. NPDC051586]|uniref:hypothetical protein n=1 Tax=Kribbella sp. NPDC051586 TaxID=3364118 RepID=UPI0037A0FADA